MIRTPDPFDDPARALIDIRNATICRGTTTVFAKLNLRIEQRQNTAILGPNGCGKTTLVKLLTREVYPVSGPDTHVKILGEERFNVWRLRQRIAVVSMDVEWEYTDSITGLDCVLSGYSPSLSLNALNEKISSAQKVAARELMQDLGVGSLENSKLCEMSVGQQRRCLLARGLVREPQTLILDEPTAGMDFPMTAHYLRILRSQMRAGRTIVLTTHHVNEIPPEIERVVLLKNGSVFADGAKSELLTSECLSALYEVPVDVVLKNGYAIAVAPEQ